MQLLRSVYGQLKRMSLKTRVTVLFLVMMSLLVFRVSSSTRYYLVELQGQEDVNKSLKAAHQYLYNHVERFDIKFRGLSRATSRLGHNAELLKSLYLEAQTWPDDLRPDTIFFIDTQGHLLFSGNTKYSATDAALMGSVLSKLPSVEQGLMGVNKSGFEVLPEAVLRQEKLLKKASVQIIPTPNARSPVSNVENDALVITSCQPVYEGTKLAGVLVGQQIVNNRFSIVDSVDRDLNSRATIFLGNVRVSTSVPDQKGHRAVGTLMSAKVQADVISKGINYAARAFVVNDWYITAYEPIRDVKNRVIGAYYVGIREEPLLARQRAMEKEIRSSLLILTVVFVIGFYWLYRSIISPVRKMSSWALRYARGTRDSLELRSPNRCWEIKQCGETGCPAFGKKQIRCWLVPGNPCRKRNSDGKDVCAECQVYQLAAGNEIDQLADAFNLMAAFIQQNTESLQKLNMELEDKNTELTDQRDELECQKEQLMALNEELQESLKALDDSQSIIYALAVAVEAKDTYTRGHSERVADYSVRLAKAVGLPVHQQDTIRGAALLHDIGKIGISGTILRKPSTLTAIEFQQVKKHPTIGEQICSSLKFAKGMLPIIRHHHEHYNGKGYPDGLKGEKIPFMARIVAVADAFDAMTSDRPYRSGMSLQKALDIMENGAGSQWDPDLIPIFTALIRDGEDSVQDAAVAADSDVFFSSE